MKTYIKIIFGTCIFLILGGFFTIYVGMFLKDRAIISWGITCLLLAFILFVIGELEHFGKPPHDKNHYSL